MITDLRTPRIGRGSKPCQVLSPGTNTRAELSMKAERLAQVWASR